MNVIKVLCYSPGRQEQYSLSCWVVQPSSGNDYYLQTNCYSNLIQQYSWRGKMIHSDSNCIDRIEVKFILKHYSMIWDGMSVECMVQAQVLSHCSRSLYSCLEHANDPPIAIEVTPTVRIFILRLLTYTHCPPPPLPLHPNQIHEITFESCCPLHSRPESGFKRNASTG